MPRFKLRIEYEGTRYSGWQVQQNARTIQGELIGAIKKFSIQIILIFKELVELTRESMHSIKLLISI
jgi:tRNA pseudouridine(38-40) synthase